jgi:hypothetical protein
MDAKVHAGYREPYSSYPTRDSLLTYCRLKRKANVNGGIGERPWSRMGRHRRELLISASSTESGTTDCRAALKLRFSGYLCNKSQCGCDECRSLCDHRSEQRDRHSSTDLTRINAATAHISLVFAAAIALGHRKCPSDLWGQFALLLAWHRLAGVDSIIGDTRITWPHSF